MDKANYGHVFWYESLTSTQDEAKRLLETGTSLPFAVLARHQTSGRGRAGHQWQSLPGNLQGTLAVETSLPLHQAGQYAFVVGLALRDTLQRYNVGDITLKWPNDVLVQSRKMAGILLETVTNQDNTLHCLLIGTGVNIANAPVERIALKDCVAECPSVEDVFNLYHDNITALMQKFHRDGFGPIRQRWLECAHGIGQPLHVRLPNEAFTGIFEDIGTDGSLLVKIDGETSPRRVVAGDVFFGDK